MRMPKQSYSWICPYFLALMFIGLAVVAACMSEDVGYLRITIASVVLIFLAYLCGTRRPGQHCER